MSRRPMKPWWLKFVFAEWLATTGQMSPEARGAFITLISWIAMFTPDGTTIRDDDGVMAQAAGMSLKRWRRVRAEVLANFIPEGAGWVSPWLRQGTESFAQFSEHQRKRAAGGGPTAGRRATSQSQNQNKKEESTSITVPTPTARARARRDHGPTDNPGETLSISPGQRSETDEGSPTRASAAQGSPRPIAEGVDAMIARLAATHGTVDLEALKPRPRISAPAPARVFEPGLIEALKAQHPPDDVDRIVGAVAARHLRKPYNNPNAALVTSCRNAANERAAAGASNGSEPDRGAGRPDEPHPDGDCGRLSDTAPRRVSDRPGDAGGRR